MEDEEASRPSRGRGGNIATRRGSPPRSQHQTNRTSHNSWATQRGRAPTNRSQQSSGAISPSHRGQRQRGNRRSVSNDLQSPEQNVSNSSSETGLNGIRQLLDNIDASIPDDSIITIPDVTSESNQATQAAVTSFNNLPPTYSFIHGGRRFRPRLPLNGGASHRGANNSRRSLDVTSTDNANSTQQRSPRNNTSTSPSRNDGSIASRRQRNIPPLRFSSSNMMVRELSSDSSDDQSYAEISATRPHIQPAQDLGTEDDPYELSPESPEGPNVLLPSSTPEESGNRTNPTGNNSSGGGNNRRRRAGRGRFGNSRHRTSGSGAGMESNPLRGAGVASSSSLVLPPPGTMTDEELARRLQEEEWEAASVGGADDGQDGAMLRNLDSPLHLFGAGYHRRRPPFGLHLPPLSGMEDGSDESESLSLAARWEDANPFFFDGAPGRNRYRGTRGGRRSHRYLSPLHLHQLSLLTELREHLPQGDSILELLNAVVAPYEMESLISLDGLDEANGGDYEALLALSERIGEVSRGLSQADINKLPTRKHKAISASRNDGPSSGGATGGAPLPCEQLQCHICLSDYENGDQKRLLPCGHDFHKDCVDTWLKTNATCPVCRSEVKPKRS